MKTIMIFGIKKSYQSSLPAQAVWGYIENLRARESGFWIFKSKHYSVNILDNSFSLKKNGGGRNGPAYPLIEGRISDAGYVRVDLKIRPSYFIGIFLAIVPCILIAAIFLSDKMTVNGVYRSVYAYEKIIFSLLATMPSMVLYLWKVILPMADAEEWLIRKLSLKPIDS